MKVSQTLRIMLAMMIASLPAFTLLAADGDTVLNGAPVCVAIFEPEVLGDLPAEKRKTLGGTLDTLLTESLAGQKGFVLVDRQALNKVLDEQKVRTAKQVAQSLRPFWSAGVLICAKIDVKARIVVVEAVAAQSGQLLGAVYTSKLDRLTTQAIQKAVQPKLKALGDNIQSSVALIRDKKQVEVVGRLDSKLQRGQVLVDELVEAARARVLLNSGLTLLVPRQPLNTREERLLTVMGLARPARGDATSGFTAAPDATIRVIVTEQPRVGAIFEETPVKLTLQLGGDSKIFKFTGGTLNSAIKPAMAWLDGKLKGIGSNAPAADDTARAAALSRQIMLATADWKTNNGSSLRFLPPYVNARILAIASRASHLDPTNEEAGWLVAMMWVALDPNTRTHDQNRRVFHECRKYIDRFPKAHPDRREIIMRWGGFAGILSMRKYAKSGGFAGFLKPPNPNLYVIASPVYRMFATEAVQGRRRHGSGVGNGFELFSRQMIVGLIPHIPKDKLDEEYKWWKRFFVEQVDTLSAAARARNGNDIGAPWELIDAAFAVRRKDVPAVRRKLVATSRKVPKRQTLVWGGDKYNPYLVPIFLKAAGDPRWKTWDVTFGADKTVQVSLNEMTAFMSRLSPTTAGGSVWDMSSLPTLEATKLTVPEKVRAAGFVARATNSRAVEALGIAGDDMLLITPGIRPSAGEFVTRQFVLPFDRKAIRLGSKATELPWPEKDKLEGKPLLLSHCITQFNGKPTIWLGTKQHGVARFDKVNGQWRGRWYNSRHGLPSNGATYITTCRNGQAEEILVVDREAKRMFQEGTSEYGGMLLMIWTLNSGTGKSTLVHDGSKDAKRIYNPVAELADGQKILLTTVRNDSYHPKLDVARIRRITESRVPLYRITAMPFTIEPNGVVRIWQLADESACLKEFSTRTLTCIKNSAPGNSSQRGIGASPSGDVRGVLERIYWRSSSVRFAVVNDWPAKSSVCALGRGDVLWMAFSTSIYSGHSCCLVGYRPAPAGSKQWAEKDLWIGPFYTPGKALIYDLQHDGNDGMLLSTQTHVLMVSSSKLVAQARKAGNVRSTQKWREEYRQRIAKGSWLTVVPVLIIGRKHDQAEKLLKKKLTDVGSKDPAETLRLLLWQGRLYAEQKEHLTKAIELYDQAARDPKAGGTGEAFARASQIVLLFKAGRYKEMLDLAERVQTKFPQMKARGTRRGMGWYIAQARKKLTAKPKPR